MIEWKQARVRATSSTLSRVPMPDLVLLDVDGVPPSWTVAISIELRVRALGF
jgi:hypothetical protein